MCRFGFPRFPLARTIFVDSHKTIPKNEKLEKEERKDILRKVRDVLTEEKDGKYVVSEAVQNIMKGYPNVVSRPGGEYLKDTGSNNVSTIELNKDHDSNDVATSETIEDPNPSDGLM